MAAPSSGPISFNDINIAAGNASGSEADFGELGLGAGFLQDDLGVNKFYSWFPNLIMLGSYLTAQSPAYSNDSGRNWTELDMTGWNPFRVMGVGYQDVHGFGTRDGETYGFSGQDPNSVTVTGTRRTFISHDHGTSWEHTDVSAMAYANIFPEPSAYNPSISTNLSFIGSGYHWNSNKGRSIDGEKTWSTVTNTTVLAPFMCCSSSGQYVITGTHNGWVKRSSNYGATWTEQLSTTGKTGTIACDDSGQYVIAFRTATDGRFSLSDDYGSTWTLVSLSNQWCHGTISKDSNFIVYTNGSDRTLNYSTDQGYSWTSIDISAEFTYTERTWVYQDGSNDTVYLSSYNNASFPIVYKYVKGDGGITEVYDFTTELNGKALYRTLVSKFNNQTAMLARDMSGNLYHIPDVDNPIATQVWDADVKEGNQTVFFAIF